MNCGGKKQVVALTGLLTFHPDDVLSFLSIDLVLVLRQALNLFPSTCQNVRGEFA